MSSFFLLLQRVHARVHDCPMKLNYSEPKIFTGGVDISLWSKLSTEEKKEALSKNWCIYYSFRNPTSGKLKRQVNIKAGANKFKTKKERLAFLKTMQQALLELLEYGFNPYLDNSALEQEMFSGEITTEIKSKNHKEQEVATKEQEKVVNQEESISLSISEAFKMTLELKVNMMNKNSYVQYKSRIGLFEKWLKEKDYFKNPISSLNKKIVI